MDNLRYSKYIFGRTRKRAFKYLNEILLPSCFEGNIVKRVTKSGILELVDGTIYEIVTTNYNALGLRCDVVYIDIEVDEDMEKDVILPMLSTSRVPKHKQIYYWG